MYIVSWPLRWCAAIALALYSLVIVKLTLLPAAKEQHTFSLLNDVALRLSHGHVQWDRTEVLANVALFVPAGFLLCLVVGRAWAAAILCLLASVAIELAQQRWLPSRVPSAADVEHNTIGGVIGAVLGWPIVHALRMSRRRAEAARAVPPVQLVRTY